MSEKHLSELDLPSVATAYVDQWLGKARPYSYTIKKLAGAVVHPDEAYCRRVAEYYDRAPRMARDARLLERYERLQEQSLRQYRAIVDAGIEVKPWLGAGQPYQNSRRLREQVLRTRRLYVFLTGRGHGPARTAQRHPMREPSGVRVDGVEFCHNDVFRAVHDIFGHVMFGNGFGPKGELLASLCQMSLYSPAVHQVLFTEQIGQICWFFYGPHLLDRTGALPRAGDPDYLPPAHRPYPEQKVFVFPAHFVGSFMNMFQIGESSYD